MSERITHIIQEIRLKFQIAKEEIQHLKNQNTLLINELEVVKNDNSSLLHIVQTKELAIVDLQSEIEVLSNKLNQPSVIQESNEALINELVKEIDDCISLLKK
jgi:chromosome segregation ATPase